MHPPRTLVLLALLTLAVLAPPGVAAADGDYEQVVDLTFPLPEDARYHSGGYTYTNDYSFPRSRGAHGATDVMADAGTPVHAAVGGTVRIVTGMGCGGSWTGGLDSPPSWGYAAYVDGDDGRMYRYLHLGEDADPASGAYAPGITCGSRVERGEHLGYVGSSGNASASAPHLHFEIHDDDVTDPYGDPRINPYFSLRDAEARGDFPLVCEPSEEQPFCDVDGGAHAEDIRRLTEGEVVRGCGEGRFCPDRTVTRAESVTLIVRGWAIPKAPADGFDDVAASRWYAEYVGGAAEAGITEGCTEGAFCPERELTRGEMASLLARQLDLELDEEAAPAFDDLAQSPHAAAIGALAETGIARGYGDGTFRPTRDVTRAEMASFVQRALDW